MGPSADSLQPLGRHQRQALLGWAVRQSPVVTSELAPCPGCSNCLLQLRRRQTALSPSDVRVYAVYCEWVTSGGLGGSCELCVRQAEVLSHYS